MRLVQVAEIGGGAGGLQSQLWSENFFIYASLCIILV